MKHLYTRIFAFFCLFASAFQATGQDLVLSTQVTPVGCANACNGSINLTVTGGTPAYSYFWSNSANSQDLTGLCAGVYTVTVLDAAGLKSTASVTVPLGPPLEVVTCATNILCNGDNTGRITLQASGGQAPYTYLWSTGNTTQNIQNIPAGTYTPTVVDANGCTATAPATVTQPTPILIASAVTNSSTALPMALLI